MTLLFIVLPLGREADIEKANASFKTRAWKAFAV